VVSDCVVSLWLHSRYERFCVDYERIPVDYQRKRHGYRRIFDDYERIPVDYRRKRRSYQRIFFDYQRIRVVYQRLSKNGDIQLQWMSLTIQVFGFNSFLIVVLLL